MEKRCTVCDVGFEGHKHKKTCSPKCAHRAQAIVVRELMLRNNPMKRADVAQKMAATRSQRFKDDPTFGELVASYTRKAWADGKYAGVNVGKCKWYTHIRPDGTTVKLQGTWEVAFARWLDTQGLTYDAHKGRWNYTDEAGTVHSYYPDFYVHAWEATIDVKGAFWDAKQASKLDFVRVSNPTQHLIIVNKQWLTENGIDYVAIQRELLVNKT